MLNTERLLSIIEEKGLTAPYVERKSGVSRGCIQNWCTGKYQPTQSSLQKVADYLEVSIAYLSGESDDPTAPKGVSIPVLGYVAAGIPISAIEDVLDYEEISKDMANKGEFFGLKIKGDSMFPRIIEGDVVIVKVQNYADNGDIVIAQVNGDEATCKKIIMTPTGMTLQPLNPQYKAIEYTMQDVMRLPVRIIGKVVELRGKL